MMTERPRHRYSQRPLIWRVEIDFDNDGFGADDNVTSLVADVSVSIGLADDLVARVGTATIRLYNGDGRFTPGNRGSKYWGKVVPRLPVRISVNDGDNRVLFSGFTRSWENNSRAVEARMTTVECEDLMGVIQGTIVNMPIVENISSGEAVQLVLNSALRAPIAEGRLTPTANPAADDTITVDGHTYTYKSTLSLSPAINEILIGSTHYDTIDNTILAINGGSGEGDKYKIGAARSERITAAPAESYFELVRRENPVRWYRLGETSGSVAKDTGSNERDGTYIGVTLNQPSLLSGDNSPSAYFDGVTDHITIPALALDDRNWAAEIVFKPDNPPPSTAALFGGWTSWALYEWFDVVVTSAGAVAWRTGGDDLWTPNGKVTFGAVNHIMVVHKATLGRSYIYVNGALAAEGAQGSITQTPNTIYIGTMGVSLLNPYAGYMSDFVLYYTLPDDDIAARHYAAMSVAPAVVLQATVRGAYGNAYPIAKSSASIAITGSTLSGGVDLPAEREIAQGRISFPLVGDRWSSEATNAMSCIQDLVESEYGFFYINREGKPCFRDNAWRFKQRSAQPLFTLRGEPVFNHYTSLEDIYNVVRVSFTPRQFLTSGVVAKAQSIVRVEGTGVPDKGGVSFTRSNPQTPPPPEATVIMLQYVDSDTGQISSARNLVRPLEPGVDFTANDNPDGESGYDYTYDGLLTFGLAAKTSNVELTIHNRALGELYLKQLQVRGEAIVSYNPVTKLAEDAKSIERYGRREKSVMLPLPVSEVFAQTLADYLVSREGEWVDHAINIDFGGQRETRDGISLLSADIGDTFVLCDSVAGAQNMYYMITGIQYALSPGEAQSGRIEVSFNVTRLDSVSYGIFDDEVLGRLDEAMRLTL